MTPAQLKKLRNKLDLSQEGLGDKLDCDGRTIRRYEAVGAIIPKWLEYAVKYLAKNK